MNGHRLDSCQGAHPPTAATAVGLTACALGAGGAVSLALLAAACARHVLQLWEAGLLEGPLSVAHGLETIAVAGAGVVAAWMTALLLVGAAASLPGRSAAPLRAVAAGLAPRLAPRMSALLVAVAMASLPVGSAHAAPLESADGPGVASAPSPAAGHGSAPDSPPHASGPRSAPDSPRHTPAHPSATDSPPHAPEPGWRPTAAPVSTDPSVISLVSRGGAEPDAVVVRAGDTLWDIAARHLGEDADAAAIAAAWPRWYAANRTVIGPDPDHILPGTHLVPPESVGASS